MSPHHYNQFDTNSPQCCPIIVAIVTAQPCKLQLNHVVQELLHTFFDNRGMCPIE